MTPIHAFRTTAPSTCLAALLLATPCAFGQATERAIFVSNNGDLDGGVTSFIVGSDGTLTFADHLTTGSRSDIGDPCAGCNAQSAALSPDGRFLAIGHASGDGPSQQLTIALVASDATLLNVGTFAVPSAPLDLVWTSNIHLAVTRTNASAGSQVVTYRFNPSAAALFSLDAEATGVMTDALAIDREHGFLYAQDSSGNTIQSFAVIGNGTLSPIQTLATEAFGPVGLGLTPDGGRLYACGGDEVIGFGIDATTGTVAVLPNAPFVSPGDAPTQVVISNDGQKALVAHEGDDTVHVFSIDTLTGALTPTAFVLDAGTLGTVAVLDDLVFVTDESSVEGQMGVNSYTLGLDGSLTQNGPVANALVSGPHAIATWSPPPAPPCLADVDGSGGVGFGDILHLFGAWGPCAGCPDDLDESGDVGFADLLIVIGQWGPCAG